MQFIRRMERPRRRVRSTNDGADVENAPNPTTRPADPTIHEDGVATGFADIYGSLTSRQTSVITIGSAIGTGLMVTSGLAMSMSGPVALLVSYSIVGFTVYLVLSALGEVTAWLPKTYTVADQAVRFCDPALGFSLGWIYWLKYAIITPNQLVAASLVISFWVDTDIVNPGVWVTIFLLVTVALNCLHHGLPSQVEFYVSSFKLLVMAVLMILSLVIALGGGPDRDLRGFRYFKDLDSGDAGSSGGNHALHQFFKACGTMSPATFAYIGSERSAIVARAPNTRKVISRSINHTFYRLLVFHLLGIILVGMMIPPKYISATWVRGDIDSKKAKNPAVSPFVAALCLAHIAVAPHLLNACILIFILSIASYDLYLATKAICDLSLKHRAPGFLSRTNRRGIPVYALGVCVSLALLAYINVGRDSSQIFDYFVKMVTMLGILTWMSILLTHISFVRARRAQGISDSVLVFRASFGMLGSWLGMALCVFISSTMIFNSIDFVGSRPVFDYKSFVAAYIGVPIYLFLYLGYKLVARSSHVSPTDADLWSGKTDAQSRRPRPVTGSVFEL